MLAAFRSCKKSDLICRNTVVRFSRGGLASAFQGVKKQEGPPFCMSRQVRCRLKQEETPVTRNTSNLPFSHPTRFP